jgi:ABC-type branched-subunit amino acid transport system substrate-binding protein
MGGVAISPLSEVGAPLPLTGRYSVQGAQVRAGLELWARHRATRLILLDDGSNPQQAAHIHEQLVARGCRLVLGAYGSDSMRAVARVGAGGVVWNHGAAADDVQRLPGVVSLASPASRYLVALGRAVAQLRPGAGVAIAAAAGRFAGFAAAGLKQHAAALGLGLVDNVDDADALLACGPLGWEIDLFHRIGRRRLLLGGCSPALAAFPQLLGDDPEGLLAPVQWHPDVRARPELGPAIVALDDYLAAQAYAACLIAERCLELDPDRPLAAAQRLRTTTFFGSFELDKDGLQAGHRLSVIQWRRGRRELVVADAGA